jgi:hypothetical protein
LVIQFRKLFFPNKKRITVELTGRREIFFLLPLAKRYRRSDPTSCSRATSKNN